MRTVSNDLMEAIITIVGSKELAYKWWDSPNKAFDMITPYIAYCENPQKVIDYIYGYLLK